ncbi:MAG: DUF6088 family protein [Azoarcus sp.]|nr:DUF6088 family protein [Azoarcus sp.]
MSRLAQAILSAAQALPEGGLLLPKEFLHLASRAAVDQTFTRLVGEGALLRVGRGLYAAPVVGRFGARPPATETVVAAIEAATGEAIVANGAAEANALGLSTQVPTREVFITSGRSRTLRLGNRNVELRHGNKVQLLLGQRPAGRAIRALAWLGPEHGPAALRQLRAKLSAEEWKSMQAVRASMPTWMARAVSAEGGQIG